MPAPLPATTPAPLPIRPQDAYLFAHRRRRLWELAAPYHCSVIGTCLTTEGLRKVLAKLGRGAAAESDHALHSLAVGLAAAQGPAARLLDKALDAAHAAALRRFDKARSEAALRALWAQAAAEGDIPGPYWALLTHADAGAALQAEAFAQVHMLSHLVGAANRADIRRLAALEAERAALLDRLARQQSAMHQAVTARDATIEQLRGHLLQRAEAASPAASAAGAVAEELRRRLEREARQRGALQQRLDQALARLAAARREAAEAATREATLQAELAALDASLAPAEEAGGAPRPVRLDLGGMALLYVGGRPGQAAHLRRAAQAAGATLLLHDGGVEQAEAQLAGLLGRVDAALFPVDCVSHDAALTVKRLCRRQGKPFVALRAAGGAAFLAALQGLARQRALPPAGD
ncbi:DUF2325 domain-containing protein [Roseomonas sp. 18066]|uniref:DUF2325 domain-containing protein n=1 Tax=Roseomonas sp. 18066 TaxID=2681412 RepID=UPI00135932AF|nr:DUF2325 domain-containing protein [Roseomonas sp. 18066]